MPSGRVHRGISEILLGEPCEKTNKVIDYPVRFLGRGHRVLFHDLISAIVLGYLSDDLYGIPAGALHLGADKVCSKYRIIKKILEHIF
jgi:hypothetical protein